MRLTIQRCLILLLCCSATQVLADYEWRPSGGVDVTHDQPVDFSYLCTDWSSDSAISFSKYPSNDTVVLRCTRPSGNYKTEYLYPVAGIDGVVGCGESGVDWSTGYCAAPACDPPNYVDPDTNECLPPQEPGECQELGQFYNPENQQCTTSCPSGGTLGSYCLTQPDPTCSPSSPDYQGTAGWGDDHRYVCSGETSCGAGESYAFREMDDGSWSGVCVSDESNPPVCPGGFESVLEIYDGGFACGNLNEDKEDPTRNDTSDGDSDGDGVADDTGMAGQLEDIKGLLNDGNNERGNIGQTLKKGFGDLKDAISNIPGGGGSGDTGAGQTEIVGEDGNAITWSGGAITMEVQDGLNELNAVQGEYESLIANIRSEMSASFGSFTGAGGLQDNTITLFGQTFNAGLSKFGADLSMIGSIILFAATFAALGIIMGARD